MLRKTRFYLFVMFLCCLAVPGFAVFPGNCLDFTDGDYVAGTGMPSTLTAVTLEGWVNHTDLTGSYQRYLTIGNENAVIRFNGGTQLHFYIRNSAGTIKALTANVLTTGEWLHVAGTYDGTTMKLYLNGVQVATQNPSPAGFSACDGTFLLSRSAESMHGKLDDFRFWTVARTQAQIQDNRFLQLTGSETGLRSYWRMDSSSGTAAVDDKGFSNGTMYNMTNANWTTSTVPTITSGDPGNALSFDGVNDYMLLSTRSGLPIYNNGTSNAYSINMWVKGNAQDTKCIYIEANSAGGGGIWFLTTSEGKLQVNIVDNSFQRLQRNSQTTIFDGTWHHIAWVDNNGTASLYVDGVPDGGNYNYSRGTTTIDIACVGAYYRTSVSSYFNGQIDEISFWKTALTQAQVRQYKNVTKTGSETNLAAYYQLDETTGNICYDIASANQGNHGKIYNMSDASRVDSSVLIGTAVSGTISSNTIWSASCISVVGNVTINNGVTLTINPGVLVNFTDSYAINVQGRLLAVGTAQSNITFTANSGTGWRGIRLDNTPATNDSTKFVYCRLENGIATGTTWDNAGGAIYANIFSKILLRNSVFHNNRASSGWDGGAVYLRLAGAKIENCTFTNNYTSGYGGALCIAGGYAAVTNTVFRSNSCATKGGALYIANTSANGSTYFANCIFYGNSSSGNGGAIGLTNLNEFVLFANCTIWNNSAVTGGGIELGTGSVTLHESIIWGNTASSNGSQIAITGGTAVGLSLYYCDIQGGPSGIYCSAGSSNSGYTPACFDLDPGMSYSASNPGTGFMLSSMSPCINSGNDGYDIVPSIDINGNPRRYNNTMATGNLNAALDKLDIGAIEDQNGYAILPQETITIDASVNITKDLYLYAGRSLNVSAGITLSFAAAAHAYIYGNLTANGNSANRITFTELVPGSGWQGLHFLKTTGFTPSSTLSYCIVEKGNMLSGDATGGNIYINQHTTVQITSCIIRNGLAEIGGGIYTTNSTTTIINTLICDNVAISRGPGFYSNSSTVKLINCTIADNTKSGDQSITQYLAPVYLIVVPNQTYITNCVIYGNNTTSPVYTDNAALTTVTYSDVEGGFTGTGNIDINPSFTGEAGHPYSLNIWSYCINTGTADVSSLNLPSTDLKNNPRFYVHPNTSNNRVDMGAYEVQSYLAPTNVVASDGNNDYPGYVNITWSFNPAYNIQPNGFRIYRNGSQYDTVDGMTLSYSDNEPIAGTIYTYKVQAYTNTENAYSTEDQGYIKPNGIISGKVETTNGNPVVAVKVTITPSTGYCLQLSSTSVSAISFTNPQANLNQNFTLEMWVKTLSSNVQLFRTGTHILSINASGLVQYTDGSHTLIQQNTGVDINNDSWHHIAIVSNYTDNRVDMYLDDTRAAYATGYRFMNYVQSDVYVPAGFTGGLDDIRIWTAARDSSEVVDAMSIVVPYDSPGLVAYWAMNEGTGSNTFDATDYSHNGSLTNCSWSTAGPAMQLGALTNEWGEYIISQIGYGTATNFSVRPAKTGHMFQPEQRVVTLSASNIAANNVDFTDNSMIPITGYAKFQGTICPVVGAVIMLNGVAAMPRITTDDDGYYTLEVEHGTECIVAIDYNGHEFNRQWNLGAVTYPRNNINFEDVFRTEYQLEVVGGQDSYPIGDFNVTMASVDGLYTREITSQNWGSGFISVSNVVPLEYNVTVNPGTNDPFALLIDDQFQSMKTKHFDLRNPDAVLDTLRYEWRASLEVEVAWPDTMELKHFPEYPASEFYVVNQNDWVEVIVRACEDYNYGSFTDRKSYLSDCDITINDEVGPEATHDDSFDGEVDYTYRFAPYLPNINGGYARQYQNKLEFTIHEDILDRTVTQSEWCLTQGAKPLESTFATTSPEIPFLVLHDPPGDGSFTAFNQSNSHSFAMSTSVCKDQEHNAYGTLHLGHDFETETGGGFFSVGTEWNYILDLNYGFTMDTTQDISKEQTMTLTTSQEYRTSEGGDIIGDGADLFVGGALNLVWGLTKELSWDDLNQSAVLDSNLMVTPNGFDTIYLYTDMQIRNAVIPNCIAIGDTSSANLWQSYLDKNEYNKAHAIPNPNHPSNISFNAGAGYSYEEENSKEMTTTTEFETTVSHEFGANIGFIVDGTGFEGGYKFKTQITTGKAISSTNNATTTTSFTLADDDEASDLTFGADYFTVDIKKDPVYGTPVFDLISGATSNHWEPNTQPRDGVMMTANTYTASNVPQDQPAAFILYLNNTSQTNEPRRYYLECMHATNSIGAIIKVNGVTLEDRMAFDIDGGATAQAVLTVEPGPLGYELNDLTLEFYAEGDRGFEGPEGHYFDVFKSFDILWEAPYSRVAINYPQEGWLINQALNDTLNIIFTGYDLNKPDFKSLKLQYKHPEATDWLPALEVLRADLESHPSYISVPWDVSSLSDGIYEIRAATTDSIQADWYSAALTGTIDRSSPEVWGIPQPSDGILQPGDVISLTFNEDIDPASITDNVALRITSNNTGVDATVQVYNNTVSIVPNIANYWMENQTVEVNVHDLTDRFGNPMITPTEWEFYVNANPVYWQNSKIELIKPIGQALTFSANLVNSGGQTSSFAIQSLGGWLSATPLDGTLLPLDTETITFTVSSQLGFGTFRDTVYADIPGLGKEPLVVEVSVLANPPAWTSTATFNYDYSMTITGQMSIDGALSADQNDIIGAFVLNAGGDYECRGVAHTEHVDYGGGADLFFLTLYSDIEYGEDIVFRVWDASSCKDYYDIAENYTFESGAVYGSFLTPDIVHPTSQLIKDINLGAGWTWISTNLLNPASMQVNSVLSSLSPTANDLIKGQTQYAQYASGTGWVGSLSTISTAKMYKVKMAAADKLTLTGTLQNPNTTPISYATGWNWISYIPHVSISVGEALANAASLTTGDMIKSQRAYAQYVSGYGWVGSLRFMNPGEGYLLKTAGTGSFTYPDYQIPRDAQPLRDPDPQPSVPGWTLNPMNYEYSANITAIVQLDGASYPNDLTVGAFVGNECRGIAGSLEVNGGRMYFLTVYANAYNETLTFKVYNPVNHTYMDLPNMLPFINNQITGSPASPYAFLLPAAGMVYPKNVRIDIYNDNVRLRWDALPGASSYRVYSAAAPDATDASWTLEAQNIVLPSWIDARAASQRYYKVTAIFNTREDAPGQTDSKPDAPAAVISDMPQNSLPSGSIETHPRHKVRKP